MYHTIEFHRLPSGKVHVYRAIEVKPQTEDLLQVTTNLHPEDFSLTSGRNKSKNTRLFNSSGGIWKWAKLTSRLQSESAKSVTYFMSNPAPIVLNLHNQNL